MLVATTEELKANVKREMNSRRISRRELASLTGLNKNTVNSFLNDGSKSRNSTKALICQKLGLNFHWHRKEAKTSKKEGGMRAA
ncbi:MAG: helix-turn-helix domain-containing protein [Deinococcota bacterium]